jgi:hypothetical protein
VPLYRFATITVEPDRQIHGGVVQAAFVMRARRLSVVIVVVLLAIFVGIAALSFGGGASQAARESTRPQTPATASSERERRAPEADAKTEVKARERLARPDPRAREALRRDIVRALERRGVATDVDRAGARAADEPEPPAAAGGMVDRIGNRPALLQRMNTDFMPLADECIEQARERVPDLRGMVAIDVKLLAERDVGAIVEDAAPAAINEVAEPELLECLRETLLSMSLPGDAIDGLDGITISLRTDPE